MKALSIQQPWAQLIAEGLKTVELRSWKTPYRGQLLICASARPEALREKKEKFDPKLGNYLYNEEIEGYMWLGHAICIVELYDIVPFTPDLADAAFVEYEDSVLYAWKLRNVQKITPFQVKGQLGLYQVDVRE